MTNVRTIHVDWYNRRSPSFHGGPQLAYQGDHLSNMVVFDNAPELPNYYLLVEMKTDDAGPVVTLPEIRLEGPYWVIPNYYTQICQKITYQVCCKTESGDFEHHSAKFEGTILPAIKHNGEPIDQSAMFDPYIDILDRRVNELIVAAGYIQIDSELKSDSGNPVQNRVIKAAIDGLGNDVTAVNGRLDQQGENILELQEGGYIADQQQIGEKINAWLDEHPEATTTVEDGSITEAKFSDALKAQAIKTYLTPEMFGAVGDGVHDDTQAVQACLTTSRSACYLSKMYAVSNTISLGDHTTLFGAGRGSCGLKYIGPASTGINNIYVVAIPYNSEFCSVHDITIDGGLKASGVCDCYNKPLNKFVGIRTQIYNLNIERYTKYGIYLDGMGSEIKNIYAIGDLNTTTGEGNSKIGMYVNSTDNKISDCRLQKNAEYGLYNGGSSNVYVSVKCAVNGTGAYITGGFLDCQLECQENLANGLELTTVTLSKLDLNVNCNNFKRVKEGAELPEPENYGVKMINVKRCNINIIGRKHSTLGSSSIGNEKAIIYLNSDTKFNNFRAEVISEDNRGGTFYIDGISAANNIVANGSRYGNKDILTSQGYKLINRDCRYIPRDGVSDVDFDIRKEMATLTLATLTGNVNLFSCIIDDVDDPGNLFDRICVIQEINAGDSLDDGNINTLRLVYPLMLMDGGQYVSPTSTVSAIDYRYIISYFDNLAGAHSIWFRTSTSNNCTYPEHQVTFRIYGLPKS